MTCQRRYLKQHGGTTQTVSSEGRFYPPLFHSNIRPTNSHTFNYSTFNYYIKTTQARWLSTASGTKTITRARSTATHVKIKIITYGNQPINGLFLCHHVRLCKYTCVLTTELFVKKWITKRESNPRLQVQIQYIDQNDARLPIPPIRCEANTGLEPAHFHCLLLLQAKPFLPSVRHSFTVITFSLRLPVSIFQRTIFPSR